MPTGVPFDPPDPPARDPSPSRPAGAAAPGSSPTPQPSDSETNSSFLRARLVVFTGIMLGYGCFYLTRNSLPYVAPVMEADPSLGFNLTKVGILTSAFPIAYSSSKASRTHVCARNAAEIRTSHRRPSLIKNQPCSPTSTQPRLYLRRALYSPHLTQPTLTYPVPRHTLLQ